MPRIITSLLLLLTATQAFSQEKWDLRKCVDYALANNISVKQADLDVRFSQLDYQLSKGEQWPTLNFGISGGYNFGLRENPTTGVLENRKVFSTTTSLQSGVTLFNWFSIRNSIEASKLNMAAEKADVIKVQNDVALSVAVAYLQILLNKEQVRISEVILQTDISQLELTRKKVKAGVLPELSAAELEAQFATDSSDLITAQATYQRSVLQMKAILNLDAALPFDVTTPPVDIIPLESLADLQPEKVYELAVINLPQQKANELRIQSAKKSVASARGQLYPNISAFGNLNSSFIAFRKEPVYSKVVSGYEPTGFRVDAGGGTFYTVESPILVQGASTGQYFQAPPLFRQLSDNFGQGIGIGIQVPILNGHRAKLSYERSQLTVQTMQILDEQGKQILKQDIYNAYTDATAAIEKYNASKKAVTAAEKAYDFASKRFNANLLSTYDLLNNQNRLSSERIKMLLAQFDYVFKVKLLEFYKGQGLKL